MKLGCLEAVINILHMFSWKCCHLGCDMVTKYVDLSGTGKVFSRIKS